jgi:hypothetical protein
VNDTSPITQAVLRSVQPRKSSSLIVIGTTFSEGKPSFTLNEDSLGAKNFNDPL